MFFGKLKLILIFATVFVCLLSFDFAEAVFNPMINYQGKLTNSSDAAVTDGTYNIRVKLCADSSCNSILWTETRTDANKVQVTNGLFSILLGEVSTSSLASIDFNQDIYLQLEVGGTGIPAFETLLPRKRFASVPAAFEAGRLGGLASSSYAKIATNETISGAWSFDNILSIRSNSASPALNILQSGAGTGVSIGNGVVTTTIYGNATSTFPYGATFATTGGNVGIGTSNPTAKLDVSGTLTTSGKITTPLLETFLVSIGWTGTFDSNLKTPTNYFNFGADWHGSAVLSSNVYLSNDLLKVANSHPTISGSVLKIPGNGKANQGSFVFYTASPNSVTADAAYGGSVRMEIGADGTIGIGTTGAGKALEINSATGANLRLTYNDSDGSAANYTDFSVGSDGALLIGTSNSATTTITNGLIVNSNSLVVSKSTGYVGIGTISPAYMLSVSGDINTTGTVRINGTDYGQYFIDSSGTAGSLWQSSGTGVGHWVTTSSLGISGGSMPSGSLGQTLAYGGSGWEATSTLYVSGTSLFNSTSTFSGNIINSHGIFISGVSGGVSGSTELLSNTGFESSVSSIAPWTDVASAGSASYVVGTSSPTPVSGSNWLQLYSGAMSDYVAVQQSGLSNPGSTAMTMSFYGLGQLAGEKFRVSFFGDSCGIASEKWTYNFTMFSWDCVNYTGSSYSFYAKDFTLSAIYTQYSVSFTSLPAASSTAGLSLMFMVGSSDPGTYHGQSMVIDDFSLGYDASTQNTAFTLNAQNFSATNTTDNLISIRSNNTEKLGLTSGGNLSVTGNMDVGGTYKLSGIDIGQFFINTTGISGQIWQSDGNAAGAWVNTSSLGILPSGTSGQIMTYFGTNWVASSSAQLTSLSVNNTLGVGTNAPSAIQFEVMSSALSQLKLSYNSSNFAIFGVDSSGNLSITPSSTGSTFAEGFNGSWPPNGWSSGGDLMWQQNLVTTYEGAGAAQSGSITHGQSTWFDIDMQTVAGNITFWWKVSSESNWDKLAFCYDMDGSCTKDVASISSISGEVGWVQVSYPISAGTHSFRWLYGKDSSASSGADAGYVDNISIPTPAGQVMLVVNSNAAFSGGLLVGTTTPFASSSNYKLQVDSGSVDGDGIAVNGHIIASSYITGTTTVDLAESYPVLTNCKSNNSCPEPGDVVCSVNVSSSYYIEKCIEKNSKKTLGVITTNPGFVLGGKSDNILNDSQELILSAVALAGRVPVKIVVNTGTIQIGDEIAASDVPGFAFKSINPGRVIGTALTSFDPLISGSTGTLEIFVNPHWSIGNIEEKDIPNDLPDFASSTLNILDQFTLTIENSMQKLGLVLKNGVAKLKEIFVDKIFVKQLCIGETCIGEQQLKDLLEKNLVPQLQTNGSNDVISSESVLSSTSVVLSESTSTFSNFSSSTDMINSYTNTLNSENILPSISTTAEPVVVLEGSLNIVAPAQEPVIPAPETTVSEQQVTVQQ